MNAEENATPSPEQGEQTMEIHVRPDLEYKYRDLVNVYPSTSEMVLEFGNLHRSLRQQITIGDRIVLSLDNALRLAQALQQGLEAVQREFQAAQHEMVRQQMAAAETKKAEPTAAPPPPPPPQ